MNKIKNMEKAWTNHTCSINQSINRPFECWEFVESSKTAFDLFLHSTLTDEYHVGHYYRHKIFHFCQTYVGTRPDKAHHNSKRSNSSVSVQFHFPHLWSPMSTDSLQLSRLHHQYQHRHLFQAFIILSHQWNQSDCPDNSQNWPYN